MSILNTATHYLSILARLNREYYRLEGVGGYDTRPIAFIHANNTEVHAPVAFTIHSEGREPETVARGDIGSWLDGLPDNTTLVFPNFAGSRWIGDLCFDSRGHEFWYMPVPEESA